MALESTSIRERQIWRKQNLEKQALWAERLNKLFAMLLLWLLSLWAPWKAWLSFLTLWIDCFSIKMIFSLVLEPHLVFIWIGYYWSGAFESFLIVLWGPWDARNLDKMSVNYFWTISGKIKTLTFLYK